MKTVQTYITCIMCLSVLVLFVACSPQRKLANLLRKYPELQTDSTYYHFTIIDTLIRRHSINDSTFFIPDSGKAVVVESGNAKATLTNTGGDNLNLQVEETPDTVYVHHTDSIPVPTYEYVEVVQKKPVPFIVKFLAAIGGLALLAGMGRAAIRLFLKK